MATTHRSDLTTEIEKALADEAYDGGMGPMSETEFPRYVRRLAETASEVVGSVVAGGVPSNALAEAVDRDAAVTKLIAVGATADEIDALADLISVGVQSWQLRLIASAMQRTGAEAVADV